jgi:hypothetical protein
MNPVVFQRGILIQINGGNASDLPSAATSNRSADNPGGPITILNGLLRISGASGD